MRRPLAARSRPSTPARMSSPRAHAAAYGIARCSGRGNRQPGRGFHQAGQVSRRGHPAHGQRGRARHARQQRDPLLRAEGELASPCSRSACPAGLRPPGPSTCPMPGQRPERVRQRHDLAGAAHAGARHGRDDALGQEVRQPLAELAGDAGVAGQERAQPDRDDRPHVGGVQPGRPAGGPGQHQVALVHELLGLGEAHAGQRAHAGVHAVDRVPAAQLRPRLLAAPLHPGQQLRPEPDAQAGRRTPGLRAPGRDLADQGGRQVRRGRHCLRHLHQR